MIHPKDISSAYADHCYKKLTEAHLEKRYEDCSFYARAISEEFIRVSREYFELAVQEKASGATVVALSNKPPRD